MEIQFALPAYIAVLTVLTLVINGLVIILALRGF